MGVTKHTGLPNGRGEQDARNYKQRVNRQIKEHLKKNVGGEDIITGDGKVRVPVKGNKEYRFILDRGDGGEGQGPGGGAGDDIGTEEYEVWLDMAEVEEYLFAELDLPRLKPKKEIDTEVSDYKFDTIAKKGPITDKKATLRRNLLRNAQQGQAKVGDFNKDDLRYTSFTEKPRPKSKAVVMLMMDVSGSMGTDEKRIARLFFYWITRFLRFKYDTVDVIFISHTTEAKEVNENQFFNRVESGGTMVSSAYQLALDIQRRRYPESDWNIYVLHASDGDNWQMDNQKTFDLVATLCNICSLVGYLEIRNRPSMGAAWKTLSQSFAKNRDELGEEFVFDEVSDDKGIWASIKKFFAKDGVEDAVQT